MGRGRFPPQSLKLKFKRPAAIGELGLAIDQWPPGAAHHRVWATFGAAAGTAGGHRALPSRRQCPRLRLRRALAQRDRPAYRYRQVASPGSAGVRSALSPPNPRARLCLVDATVVRAAPRSSAPVSTRLGRRQTVLAVARLADDPAWLRIPGDHWVRAGVSKCPDLPVVDGPILDFVPVTFVVRVPARSGEVFFAGAFSPEMALPVWNPATIWLSPNEQRVRRATVPLPRGTRLAYKYTEGGSWAGAETDASCTELPNRTITVEPGLIVRDTVRAWGSSC